MKKIFLCFLFLVGFTTASNAQSTRYQTRTGVINFEASVPSFEAIEASNKSTTVVLDTSNGNIAALALVKGFRFPVALMQEHFNENYIESDEFPKAVLRGTLKDFDINNISKNSTYTLEGTLELHGVKKDVSIPISLKQEGNIFQLDSKFEIKPADFKIEIPGVVSKKIAKEVIVTVNATLNKK